MENTLIIIKPDAVRNGDASEIINLLGSYGFEISIKNRSISYNEALQLYSEHQGKIFYEKLINFICMGESFIIKATKDNAVNYWRSKISIVRDLFATNETMNAVHGSDSKESAIRELQIFFDE